MIAGFESPFLLIGNRRVATAEGFAVRSPWDGLAVVIHPENTWARKMTVEQLKKIWHPDTAANRWSDVDPKWSAETIQLYGPGPDSVSTRPAAFTSAALSATCCCTTSSSSGTAPAASRLRSISVMRSRARSARPRITGVIENAVR